MNATISHDDAAGFHLGYQGRAYRPIGHTVFDEGQQVRIASATPYSAASDRKHRRQKSIRRLADRIGGLQ